jgi:T4 bacteriophage base plate protein
MDTKPINPLVKHFRRPAIYFKLPSNGRFWPDDALDLPVTGEIPVYPMTAGDEVTLKTPDALMNGNGIVDVIKSCCPNIKDPWQTPSVDVDSILIAIRVASYGQLMPINAKCPYCDHEHDYDADLSVASSGIKCPDYDTPIEFNDLKIKLRPQKYFNVTKSNIINFEEQRIIQSLQDTSITEEVRNAKLKESMRKIVDLNNQLIVSATEYIETDDGSRVTDEEFIKEFYQNAEAQITRLIEARLTAIANEAAIPPFKLKCTETDCGKTFEVPMEFDYSRFFAIGS